MVGTGGAIGIIEDLVETGYLPPCILVGIDYKGSLNIQRFRDFAMPFGRIAFYNFLGKELIPHIDSYYRTDITSRTIIGHPYGGTIVTHCLLQHNSSNTGYFNKFIMLSGSYGYTLDPLEMESSVFASYSDVAVPSLNVSVFAAIGKQDVVVSLAENSEFYNRLESRFYKDFRFLGRIYEDHDHASVVRDGIIDGLKWVFSNTTVDFEIKPATVQEGRRVRFIFTGVEGKPPFSYEWDFGDNSTTSFEANPYHVFDLIGNYTVKLTITDGDNFTTSKQIAITVVEYTPVDGFTFFGIVSLVAIIQLDKRRMQK
ncbi:MAG: PKD domain-containing protein [Candidatus Hodarchaeales archaeon]